MSTLRPRPGATAARARRIPDSQFSAPDPAHLRRGAPRVPTVPRARGKCVRQTRRRAEASVVVDTGGFALTRELSFHHPVVVVLGPRCVLPVHGKADIAERGESAMSGPSAATPNFARASAACPTAWIARAWPDNEFHQHLAIEPTGTSFDSESCLNVNTRRHAGPQSRLARLR